MEKVSEMHPSILSALNAAKNAGDAYEPRELMLRIEACSNPIQALGEWDAANHIFAGLEEALGFMRRVRAFNTAPTPQELTRLTALIRWLIHELREWREENDPRYLKLTALFVVVQSCDSEDDLWRALPGDISQNDALLDSLARLMRGLSSSCQPRPDMPEPIWERDTVERFTKADADENWLTLSELWHCFESALVPHPFQTGLVRSLCRFDFSRLIQAVVGINQTVIAMQVAGTLQTADRFRLALGTASPWVRFACVYYTFLHQSKTEALSQEEQGLLKELLLQIAQDTPLWRKWMMVFNHYPVRYPQLQPVLGRALADMDDAAIQTYIDSISLYPSSSNSQRYAVAACLREFHKVAAEERRKALWTWAFNRWSEWFVDIANTERYSFEIVWSELDYAVSAYAVECLDKEERRTAEVALQEQLGSIKNRWHQSESDFIKDYYRLLSQLQPYAHGDKVIADRIDCLPEKHYIPSTLSTDRYLQMMLRKG